MKEVFATLRIGVIVVADALEDDGKDMSNEFDSIYYEIEDYLETLALRHQGWDFVLGYKVGRPWI